MLTLLLTKEDENLLILWERKTLRRIYVPMQEQGEWRNRRNDELYQVYGQPGIVTKMKMSRLRWLSHRQRMDNRRKTKSIYEGIQGGKRETGRPRKK